MQAQPLVSSINSENVATSFSINEDNFSLSKGGSNTSGVNSSGDNGKLEMLKNYIFVGCGSKVRALELATNGDGRADDVWTEELKGAGSHIVSLLLNKCTGKLYVGTNGHLCCFDALSGKQEWEEKPEVQNGKNAEDFTSIHLSNDGSLLISCGNGHIVALDAFTGKTVWQHSLDQYSKEGPIVAIEHKGVLVVGVDGFVTGLSRTDGRALWKTGLKGLGCSPISLAAYTFSEHGNHSTDLVFVGTFGFIVVLSMSTGATLKEVNLKGTGYKPVALLINPSKNLLFAATSGELNCFTAKHMNLMWKSNLPGLGYSYGHSLVFSGPDTIVLGMNGSAVALKVSDGTILWKSEVGAVGLDFVVVASTPFPNLLLCAGHNGRLSFLDRSTGKTLNRNALEGLEIMQVVVSTSTCNTDFNSSNIPQCRRAEMTGVQ